jgi:hypothetical protein
MGTIPSFFSETKRVSHSDQEDLLAIGEEPFPFYQVRDLYGLFLSRDLSLVSKQRRLRGRTNPEKKTSIGESCQWTSLSGRTFSQSGIDSVVLRALERPCASVSYILNHRKPRARLFILSNT